MNREGKLCPRNFQVWVAFLMGMVVIIIAIVVFDNVSLKGRVDAGVTAEDIDRSQPLLPGMTAAGQTIAKTDPDDPAWLGIEPVDVTEAMARQMGLNISGGILVSRVITGSPAEKAGIVQGDIIYEIDSRDVETSAELRLVLADEEQGDRVRLTLYRDGEREVIHVKLGVVPVQDPAYAATQIDGDIPVNLRWGIVVSALTPALVETYAVRSQTGVVVVMVVQGSAADRAGLQKGDVIRQVNGGAINTLGDFFEGIEDARENILLNICRQGTLYYVDVGSVSPFVPTGGSTASTDTDDTSDSDGLQGMPSDIPPRGKPTSAVSTSQTLGVATAQEGIGMNRPVYVPGYDQTQSGDPQDKSTASSVSKTGVAGSSTPVL